MMTLDKPQPGNAVIGRKCTCRYVDADHPSGGVEQGHRKVDGIEHVQDRRLESGGGIRDGCRAHGGNIIRRRKGRMSGV